MSNMQSFTKYEKELLPNYRNTLNHAESREEVRAAFERIVWELFSRAFGDESTPVPGVFALAPKETLGFSFREDFLRSEEIADAWEGSDLPHVLGRLAESGVNRLVNIDRHDEQSGGKNR